MAQASSELPPLGRGDTLPLHHEADSSTMDVILSTVAQISNQPTVVAGMMMSQATDTHSNYHTALYSA